MTNPPAATRKRKGSPMTAAKNVREALEEVLALAELATPGQWEHEKEEHDIGRGMTMLKSVVRQVGGENIIRLGYPSDDCSLIAAAVNLIRTHGPALLASLSATAAGDAPVVPSDHWYCPHCNAAVHPQSVTHEETHDPRFNGCGWPVFPDVKSALAAQESP